MRHDDGMRPEELHAVAVGLPTRWDDSIETFTADGQNGWIIGWHPNMCNQLRIKVMRFRHEASAYPDIEREC